MLSGLIAALLEDAEVIVTDWRDARLVPAAVGKFDLDDQIDLLMRLMRVHGPDLHVVALSQATVPALLAVAALAEAEPAAAAASLSLLGGPIDPRLNPTTANHLLLGAPPEALETTWLQTVDDGHPGAGRRVLPSLHHLLLFALAHPEPYLRAQLGAWFELAGLELANGGGFGFLRSLEDLHALIDVPAELVLQLLRDVFHAAVLFDGGFDHGGRRLRPEAIGATALLTIEAALDALVGPGQTHAAHRLTPALERDPTRPADARRRRPPRSVHRPRHDRQSGAGAAQLHSRLRPLRAGRCRPLRPGCRRRSARGRDRA